MAAKRGARPIASAKMLDSNALLFVNVKENIQLISCCIFFQIYTNYQNLNKSINKNADISAIMSGSISLNVHKVLVYMYTNFGAFFHKMHNSFGMPLH